MLASKSPSQPQAQVTACQVIDLEDGGSESGPSTEYHPLAGRPCPTCSADCDDNPIPIPETDIAQIKFSADGRQGFLVAKYNSSPTSETGGGSGQEQEKKVKSKIYHMKF